MELIDILLGEESNEIDPILFNPLLPTQKEDFEDESYKYWYEKAINISKQGIEKTNNPNLLAWYEREVESLNTDRLSRKVLRNNQGSSIFNLMYKIEETKNECTSNYILEGEPVDLYIKTTQRRALKTRKCDLSGDTIKKGTIYVSTKVFIEGIESGAKYVLKKPICVSEDNDKYLPNDIHELDDLCLGADTGRDYKGEVDYTHFAYAGGGKDMFKSLVKRRKDK